MSTSRYDRLFTGIKTNVALKLTHGLTKYLNELTL